MFYHPSEDNFTIRLKRFAFWASLACMFTLFIFLFDDNAKIPREEVTLKIDVVNKVNICLPEDEKIFKRSFFDF